MNILIADKFEESGMNTLRDAGLSVTYDPTLSDDALRVAITTSQCDMLVVRSTKVTEAMLHAGENLSLVIRAGAGYNTIDVAAANKCSIFVANCPGKNAVAVAELTMGLILALDRRIADGTADLKNGIWNKKEYGKARGVKDRTLGLLGFGQIAKAVAKRARAFDFSICAWSRSLTNETAAEFDVERCASPAEVASRCDVLSVHLAATPDTKHIVNAKLLEQMSEGGYVINTSRADVMDYDALAAAMKRRQLRVGLDVYPDEPGSGKAEFLPPIMNEPGVVCGTHHIGASTDQAQLAIANEVVKIALQFHETGRVLHCVNRRQRSEARSAIRVRHHNRPGVLACVFKELTSAGLNVEEMENVMCQGGESACAHVTLAGVVDEEVLQRVRDGHEHIISVTETLLTP